MTFIRQKVSEYDPEMAQSLHADQPMSLGRIGQSVTCLATDASLTADPGVHVRSRPGPILSWRLIMK